MFNPSRDEARRFLIDAWNKRRAGPPLSGSRAHRRGDHRAASRIPRAARGSRDNLDRDWRPESGDVNPFLHLSLHLAVAEQLSIDQPPGIRAEFERMRIARGDEHEAQHAVLECLGEVLWNAQRHGTAPDAALYLACLERQR